MKKLICVFVVIALVAMFYSFFMRKGNSSASSNYIILTEIKPTETQGLFIVSLEFFSETVAMDIQYDKNPHISGKAYGFRSSKGSTGRTQLALKDMRNKDNASPEKLFAVPFNQKIEYHKGDRIKLFHSIEDNGEVCTAELVAH